MSVHEGAGIAEPAQDLLANLHLNVREHRSGRWMWQLIDARDGTLFEQYLEFELASHARRSGLARLAELARPLPGTKMIPETRETQRKKWLVVVGRQDDQLFEKLQMLFAETPSVDIVRDRRRSERRVFHRRANARAAGTSVRWTERGNNERRSRERRTSSVDASIRARGWWFVPVHGPGQGEMDTSQRLSA
jgi:hypothetical protein